MLVEFRTEKRKVYECYMPVLPNVNELININQFVYKVLAREFFVEHEDVRGRPFLVKIILELIDDK